MLQENQKQGLKSNVGEKKKASIYFFSQKQRASVFRVPILAQTHKLWSQYFNKIHTKREGSISMDSKKRSVRFWQGYMIKLKLKFYRAFP